MAGPGARRSWVLLVVPDGARGRVRELRLEGRVLAWGAALLVFLLLGGLGSAAFLVASLPRLRAHDELVEQNLALKQSLRDLGAQMDEIQRTLGRIRFYDAQLRDLGRSPVLPGSGPWDEDELRDLDILAGVAGPAEGEDGMAMDDVGRDDAWIPSEIRPGERFADVVRLQARVAGVSRLVRELEPRMGRMAESIGDLLAGQGALPRIWPVAGHLTSGFGYRRSPIYHRRRFHTGVDLSAPRGTAVRAVAPGVVIMARYNGGYGRMVAIDHGYGVVSRYAHASRLFVEEGDRVETGQVVATVGTTGRSTGPHLHFELMIQGQHVDPMDYLEAIPPP